MRTSEIFCLASILALGAQALPTADAVIRESFDTRLGSKRAVAGAADESWKFSTGGDKRAVDGTSNDESWKFSTGGDKRDVAGSADETWKFSTGGDKRDVAGSADEAWSFETD